LGTPVPAGTGHKAGKDMKVVTGARPAVVTAACGMLAAGGALFAGEVLLSGDKYFTNMSTYEQAAHDKIIDNETAFAGVGVVIHGAMTAIGVLVGAALVVLAVVAFSGHGWARAVSWIFGLPVLLWYGLLAALSALSLVFSGDGGGGNQPAELIRRYDEAWPPWLDTLDVVLMVLVAVLLIGALVGQTIPAADAYFRRRSRMDYANPAN
jgi:hypothetical protein